VPTGLPPLAPAILQSVEAAQLAVVSLTSLFFPLPPPVYGIFQTGAGTPVLTGFASVVGFGFQRDEKLATYPIEQGGFGTYNKVAMPFGAKLQYTVNGGTQTIGTFLAQVEALVKDTNLYTVLTPYHSWSNVNVIHHDYRQASRGGVSMLTVDVWLEEVRQPVAAAQYTGVSVGTQASGTDTQTPDGQAQQNGGQVQPVAVGG
jgi:hypothetical protein